MSDYQMNNMIKLFDMVLDGCRSIEEAREKIKSLKKTFPPRDRDGKEKQQRKE